MPSDIKALAFDVFGTCVDFRGSIIKECRALGKAKGLRVNWGKFTDAWRGGYRPAMDRVRSGELPWTRIDVLHRMILDDILQKFRIADEPAFAVNADDFNDLAAKLGC